MSNSTTINGARAGQPSKHGGDQPGASTPPMPAGLEELNPIVPGSAILAAPAVELARKRQRYAQELERRRVALEILGQPAFDVCSFNSDESITVKPPRVKGFVSAALAIADELIAQTGGHRWEKDGES